MRGITASIALAAILLSGTAANANSTGGFSALALAEAVGLQSPLLSNPHKFILFQFRSGNTNFPSSNAPFTFTSSAIDCGASDVDITHFRCSLTFGSAVIQLTGAAAQDLYAKLVLAGVPSDGAAGTIHEAVTGLSCTVNVGQVKAMAGGGANCSFTPD